MADLSELGNGGAISQKEAVDRSWKSSCQLTNEMPHMVFKIMGQLLMRYPPEVI